jgi:hypothetical protein
MQFGVDLTVGHNSFCKSFCMHCCQLTIISALECRRRIKPRNKPPIKYPAILILWQRPGLGNLQQHALRQKWRIVSLKTSDPSCLHCTAWGEWKNKQQNLYGMMCTYISAMFMIMAATLQGSLGISPGCEMGLSSIWVHFISPSLLEYWIQYISIKSCSLQPMNSLKI